MVVAPGLIRGIVDENHLGFDHVAEALDQFSTRWAVVELAGKDGETPDNQRLCAALRKRFGSVTTLAADKDAAGLLLCEK
jgi:hypothetical protein